MRRSVGWSVPVLLPPRAVLRGAGSTSEVFDRTGGGGGGGGCGGGGGGGGGSGEGGALLWASLLAPAVPAMCSGRRGSESVEEEPPLWGKLGNMSIDVLPILPCCPPLIGESPNGRRILPGRHVRDFDRFGLPAHLSRVAVAERVWD